jgi:hypothetical protein
VSASRLLIAGLLALAATPALGRDGALDPGMRNPLLPGYFADPSIVRDGDEWFVFATIDPWGADTLGLWRSRNFRDWTFETPNWPTKAAATSPTSGKSKVWAPSVVKGRDGKFWMYVSVGSEIWAGSADRPAGPWRDANGGKPLIPRNFRPGLHMIDAEAFVDDDGQAYLYWGSGLNWVNGHCFVVKLKPDMVTFDGEPRDVTPPHYFEAPFMLKRGGRYFLTYSFGNTTKDTYQLRYAVGSSPMGPFSEVSDQPLLATDAKRQISSPGHHAIFSARGEDFVLYHRQALPFTPAGDMVLRQVAVDRFTVSGDRLAIVPTHRGADVPGTATRRSGTRLGRLTASGSADPSHSATAAGDDNYATSWHSNPGAAWLQADLGTVKAIGATTLRPAYPTATVRFSVEASLDGKVWQQIAAERAASGSPITLPAVAKARFVRLVFPQGADILEWNSPTR